MTKTTDKFNSILLHLALKGRFMLHPNTVALPHIDNDHLPKLMAPNSQQLHFVIRIGK